MTGTYNTFSMFPCIEPSLLHYWRFIVTDGPVRRGHIPYMGVSLETCPPSRVRGVILHNWGWARSPPAEVPQAKGCLRQLLLLCALLQTRDQPGCADAEKSRARMASLAVLTPPTWCRPRSLQYNGSETLFLWIPKFWYMLREHFQVWWSNEKFHCSLNYLSKKKKES